jgi:hypothetical protein
LVSINSEALAASGRISDGIRMTVLVLFYQPICVIICILGNSRAAGLVIICCAASDSSREASGSLRPHDACPFPGSPSFISTSFTLIRQAPVVRL